VTRRWLKKEIMPGDQVLFGQGQYLPSIRDFIMVGYTERLLRTKWVFWDSLRGQAEVCRVKDEKALNGGDEEDEEVRILERLRDEYDWNGKEMLWKTKSISFDQTEPSEPENSSDEESTFKALGVQARKVKFQNSTDFRSDASDIIHSASTGLFQLGATDAILSASVGNQTPDVSDVVLSASGDPLTSDEINEILAREAREEDQSYIRTAWEVLEEMEQHLDENQTNQDAVFSIPDFIHNYAELARTPAVEQGMSDHELSMPDLYTREAELDETLAGNHSETELDVIPANGV
jgi:hypothetical protein